MQDEEFKGTTLERWMSKEEDEEEEEEEEEEERVPQWRKGQKKEKKIYKTADEVKQQTQPPKQLIIDMRGPQAKVLSSFEELQEKSRAAKPQFLPELQHNITHLVDLKAGRVLTLDNRRRHEEHTLESLMREESRLNEQLQMETECSLFARVHS